MTSTETDTVLRYFGRCPTKGCRHRRVVEENSHPSLKRFTAYRSDVLAVVSDDGRDCPLYELGDRDHNTAMRAAGFVCPTHNRIVWFTGGRFTHNPEKVCNAKCMGATGPACDCSCSGKNHGAKWL
jgi:hypothetical protein